MTVFEKMLSDEYRQAFTLRLESRLNLPDEEREKITCYINSAAFEKDMKRLLAHDYFLQPPRQIMVRKHNSTRRRIVYCFDGNDGYLLKYMNFVLMDFDDWHADSLCSFRKENRSLLFFRAVQRTDPNRTLYITQSDIHDYGGSIDQDILIEILRPLFQDDPEFFSFSQWILTRNEFYRNGQLIKKRVSIIEGLPLGSFFNNLYLREMDFALEPHAVLYMRYADDIAFLTDTREKAEWALATIRDYAARGNLTVNEEKTRIISSGEEAEILGIQMYPGGFDIGDFALQKLCNKLKRRCNHQIKRISYGKCTREQAMEDMIRSYNRFFFGKKFNDHELNWVVHAFPIITRTDGLQKLTPARRTAYELPEPAERPTPNTACVTNR